MHPLSRPAMKRNPALRGSSLIIVVVLCAFTLFLIGSYLKSLSNHSKISYRSTLHNEGRNAAEGVAEYAVAELHRRSQANPSFGVGANPNPLTGFTLSTENLAFIAPGNGYSHVVASSVAFKNSLLSNAPSMPQAIDPEDPVNSQDPSIDQTPLSIRSMNIFAKASVLDPQTNQPITSYVSTNVQIRDQTWFNYAIFYNMDLEFHAGPNFTVYGPVHTNATAYMTAGDSNKLQFFSTLGAVGKLYRYDKYTGDTSGGHGGTVECNNKSGMLAANMYSMATNRDSRYATFHDYATSRWKSFVQDDSFSVTKFNPPGMREYVPENFATTGTKEMRNNGYLMIEPQLSSVVGHVNPYTAINDYGYKGLDSENLKFSALSGFIIQVKPPASVGAAPQWRLVSYQATDTTKHLSADNLPARDTTTDLPIIAVTIDPFNDKDDVDFPTPGSGAVIKRSLKTALLDAIVSIPYRDAGTTATVWGNGTSSLSSFTPASPATATAHYPVYDRREGHSYTTGGGDVAVPMRGAMNVLKIDFAKLNTLLNDTTGKWFAPYGSTTLVYSPALRYTGVVYVQFPLAAIDTTRFPFPVGSTANGDMIRPAQGANPGATAKTPGYAVLVTNGGTVPQLVSGADIPDGFTIATNGLMYIWGNFNSDGSSGTGSSRLPDSTAERPALIAADAVTVLSANSAFSFSTMATAKASTSSFTEVSAAILTGLLPTQPGTDLIWSGGVHNLVRLLEDWNGDYRFRGSLGVIYESEVAKGRYHEGHNSYYYDPPTRDMGYHQYLSQGRFPPATPIKRTVRRMNLQDITAAVYNAGPTLPPAFN
jgi:hypothetical protein